MDGGLSRFGSTMTMSQNKESTRHSSFEPTPNLPSIRITQKISGSTLLPSILNEAAELTKSSDNGNARLKISYIARNAALDLIQQYKTLVSVKSIAATEIPSTTTQSSGNAQGSKVPKRFERNGRRGYVFTEGISSISKRQLPSFSMPKDKILRANLPSDIVVDKQGNQYALSVNQKRDKISRKLQESPKFRQMKMFGLDNLPLIDLGRYTAVTKATEGHKMVTKSKTTKTETKHKISHGKLVKNPVAISNNFGSSPAKKNGHVALASTASSVDVEAPVSQRTVSNRGSTNLKRRQRPLTRHLAGNTSDNKVVSVGPRVNASNYISSKRYFSSNVQPSDSQYRVNEPHRNSSLDRNPSLNGMYSLAPIRFGSLASYAPPMNFDSDVPKRYSKRTYEARKHAQTENAENDMYVYFEADTSRSASSQRHRRSNRSRTSANSSSTVTSHTLQNPPPSFVSTGSDDTPSLSRFNEPVRGMLPVHEENSNDTQISPSPTEKQVPTSLKPPLLQNNQNFPENTKNDESPQPTKTEKGTFIGNIVTLGKDLSTNKSTGHASPKFSAAGFNSNALLSVPMVSVEKERFPPMKQTEFSNADVDSLTFRDSPSKLKVQTLRLFTDNKQDSNGVSSSQLSATETPLISVTSHFGINETTHDDNEESEENFSIYLQKMSISKKTMEFVSPLEVQANAKRQ